MSTNGPHTPSGAPGRRAADAGFALAMIAVAGAVGSEAWRLPPGLFDPLGPGVFPLIVAGLLALLGLLLLARLLLGRAVGQAETSLILGLDGEAPGGHRLRPGLALFTFLWLAAYVAAIASAALPFLPATLLFLAVLGWMLSGRDRRATVIAAAVALGVGGGVWLLFARVLHVPLP